MSQRRLTSLINKYQTYYKTAENIPSYKSDLKVSTYQKICNGIFVFTFGMSIYSSKPCADYVATVIDKRQNKNFKEDNPYKYLATRVFFTLLIQQLFSLPAIPLARVISKRLGQV